MRAWKDQREKCAGPRPDAEGSGYWGVVHLERHTSQIMCSRRLEITGFGPTHVFSVINLVISRRTRVPFPWL